MRRSVRIGVVSAFVQMALAVVAPSSRGQMIDRTQAPNALNDGIAKSLGDEIGPGRGDSNTPGSSSFLISRDPFRAIRRGRQIFQRKFTRLQLQGPGFQDGIGRHQHDARPRGGPFRQLRELPRPPARFGRRRGRRRHPAGQPGRPAPLRTGLEGDAGGRDYRSTSPDSGGCRPCSPAERPLCNTAARRQGDRLRIHYGISQRCAGYLGREGSGRRTFVCGRFSLRAGRSRFASSSWAPSTPRWAWTRPTRICPWPAPGAA